MLWFTSKTCEMRTNDRFICLLVINEYLNRLSKSYLSQNLKKKVPKKLLLQKSMFLPMFPYKTAKITT